MSDVDKDGGERSRDLRRKPLNEAIVELRWSLTPGQNEVLVDAAYPLFVGALYEQVKGSYPAQERLPAADVPDEFTPHIVKFRFRSSAEKWPLVQVGPGVATINFTQEYDWLSFRQAAVSFYQTVCETYGRFSEGGPPKFISYNIRYINSTELEGSALNFIQEKLHVSVILPTWKDSTDDGIDVALAVSRRVSGPGATGSIKVGSGVRDGANAVLWELAIDALSDRDPKATDDFSSWLDESHAQIDDWFFTMIAGDLHDKFQ